MVESQVSCNFVRRAGRRAQALKTPEFTDCGANPFPTLCVDAVTRLRGAISTFQASLSANRGCISNIAIQSCEVHWKLTHVLGCIACPEPISEVPTGATDYEPVSVVLNSQDYIPQEFLVSVKITATAVTPRGRIYGAESYALPQNQVVYQRGLLVRCRRRPSAATYVEGSPYKSFTPISPSPYVIFTRSPLKTCSSKRFVAERGPVGPSRSYPR